MQIIAFLANFAEMMQYGWEGCTPGELCEPISVISAIALVYAQHASADLGWVNTHAYNFFVCGPNFTHFFIQRGRDRGRSSLFPIFDILIRAGDIRGQSPKLSEIAPNFLRFCPPKFLGCGPP